MEEDDRANDQCNKWLHMHICMYESSELKIWENKYSTCNKGLFNTHRIRELAKQRPNKLLIFVTNGSNWHTQSV